MEFEVAVDRFEGDVAVLVIVDPAASTGGPGAGLLWPRNLLPSGTREGSHLTVTAALNPAATNAARKRVDDLLSILRSRPDRRGPEGKGGGG